MAPVEESICISCRSPKATLHCDQCLEPLCKNCEQYLEPKTFSFLTTIPENLSHLHYCSACYTTEVDPALESYNEVMERARNLYFFFNTQKRPPPVLKRARESVRVDACDDRDETILRLAFLAAQLDYNGVIEADITSEKIRTGAYQTTNWKGVGIPVKVDVERIERQTE